MTRHAQRYNSNQEGGIEGQLFVNKSGSIFSVFAGLNYFFLHLFVLFLFCFWYPRKYEETNAFIEPKGSDVLLYRCSCDYHDWWLSVWSRAKDEARQTKGTFPLSQLTGMMLDEN